MPLSLPAYILLYCTCTYFKGDIQVIYINVSINMNKPCPFDIIWIDVYAWRFIFKDFYFISFYLFIYLFFFFFVVFIFTFNIFYLKPLFFYLFLERKEGYDQESRQLPDAFRSKTPKGNKGSVNVTAPQSQHYKQKAKRAVTVHKMAKRLSKIKIASLSNMQRHKMTDIENHSRSTALEKSVKILLGARVRGQGRVWGEGGA